MLLGFLLRRGYYGKALTFLVAWILLLVRPLRDVVESREGLTNCFVDFKDVYCRVSYLGLWMHVLFLLNVAVPVFVFPRGFACDKDPDQPSIVPLDRTCGQQRTCNRLCEQPCFMPCRCGSEGLRWLKFAWIVSLILEAATYDQWIVDPVAQVIVPWAWAWILPVLGWVIFQEWKLWSARESHSGFWSVILLLVSVLMGVAHSVSILLLLPAEDVDFPPEELQFEAYFTLLFWPVFTWSYVCWFLYQQKHDGVQSRMAPQDYRRYEAYIQVEQQRRDREMPRARHIPIVAQSYEEDAI